MIDRFKAFNIMSGLNKSLTEASKRTAYLTGPLTKEEVAIELARIEASLSQKVKALETEITKVQAGSLRHDLKSKKLDSLRTKLSLQKQDNKEDLEVAKKKLEARQSKYTGLSGKERQTVKKLEADFDKLNPVVVPVLPTDNKAYLTKGILTFHEMLEIANGKEGFNNKDFIEYSSAIETINRVIFQTFTSFRHQLSKTNKSFKSPKTQQIFALLSDSPTRMSIENNPDLIKLCWIYVCGTDTYDLAKNNANFMKSLEKLEKSIKSNVTMPLENSSSIEDLISDPDVKITFDFYKEYLNDDWEDVLATLKEAVSVILHSPDVLYTGFTSSLTQNIADTIYYSIISAFGTPEDKILLLKYPGSAKSKRKSGKVNFLTPEAKVELERKVKELEHEVLKRPAASIGRVVDWGVGSRNVNTSYEKDFREYGKKVYSIMNSNLKTKTVDLDSAILSEVETIVGMALDLSLPADPKIETSETILSNLKDILANSSDTTKEDLIQFFIDRFEKIETVFKSDIIRQKNKEGFNVKFNKSAQGATASSTKIESAQRVLDLSKEAFNSFIDNLNLLTASDIAEVKTLIARTTSLPEKDSSQNLISSTKKAGKFIIDWLQTDVLNGLNTYETNSTKTNEAKQTKESIEANIDSLVKNREALKKEINKLKAIKNPSTDTLVQIKNKTLSLDEIDNEIKDAKNKLLFHNLETSHKLSEGPNANYKRIAEVHKARLTNFLNNSLENINIAKLRKFLDELPTDVYSYLSPREMDAVYKYIDTHDTGDSSKEFEGNLETKEQLHKFSQYMNSPDIIQNAGRLKALNVISAMFTSQLESSIGYLSNISLDPAVAQKTISDLRKHVKTLNTQSKPAARAKKLLKRLEKQSLKSISNLSVLPGSGLSESGSDDENHTIVLATPEKIYSQLLKNAKSLEQNAKFFYDTIVSAVEVLDLREQLAGPEKQFNPADTPFMDLLIKLLAKFKAELSTDINAVDLEDSMFLDAVLAGKKDEELSNTLDLPSKMTVKSTLLTKQKISTDKIKEALQKQDSFASFMELLNQAVENKTILYKKKVISAPVISGLGIKSASLLNIMSGIKNFESIESFDLSLNKQNTNILSSILDLNYYPDLFRVHSSTGLILKAFILKMLLAGIRRVDIVKQFEGNFLTIDIKNEDPTSLGKKLEHTFKTVNTQFEEKVLNEFKQDFGNDGTLEKEFSDTLDLILKVSENSGYTIYVMDASGASRNVPISKNTIDSVLDEYGEDLLKAFKSVSFQETGKLKDTDAALHKMLTLLTPSNEALFDSTLQQAIDIVKTGLNFYIGLVQGKLAIQRQASDVKFWEASDPEIHNQNEELFKSLGEKYAGFMNNFSTTTAIDMAKGTVSTVTRTVPKLDKTGKSNLDNNFLGAFIKDFTWSLLANPLVELEKEEIESEDTETVISKQKAIKEKFDIFLDGVFLRKKLSPERLDVSVDSDEAESYLRKIAKQNLSKTKKLLASADTLPNLETTGVISRKGSNSLGISIKIPRKDYKFVNITKDIVEGERLSTPVIKGKTKVQKVTHIMSFSELVRTFSLAVDKVATSLLKLYTEHTDNTLSEEIKKYRNSIVDSAPTVISTIKQLADKTPFDEDTQKTCLESLASLKAEPLPDGAEEEFTKPAELYTKAVEFFTNEDSVFYKTYSFAIDAVRDINRGFTTTQIIDAIDKALSDPSKPYDEVSLPENIKDVYSTEVQTPVNSIMSPEAITNFSKLIFSAVLTEDAINNILESMITSLNKLTSDSDTLTQKHTEIGNLTKEKETLLADISKKRLYISELITKLAGEERIAANLVKTTAKEPLTQEELPESPEITESLSVFKQLRLTTLTEDINETRNLLEINKKSLASLEARLKEVTTQLDKLYAVVKSSETAALQTKLVILFSNLYTSAGEEYKNFSYSAKQLHKPTEKSDKSAREKYVSDYRALVRTGLMPILMGSLGVKNTLSNLLVSRSTKSDTEYSILNGILSSFTDFINNILTPATTAPLKESITLDAGTLFMLMEAAEEDNIADSIPEQPTEKPTEETDQEEPSVQTISEVDLTSRNYILSMAKFLAEMGFVKARDWKVVDPKQPQYIYTISDLIIRGYFLVNIGKASDNTLFKDLKYCLNNKAVLKFTVNHDTDISVPFTRFDLIQKVASGDSETIQSFSPSEDSD